MSDADLGHGKNYLIVNVAVGMLKQLFKRESEWLGEKNILVIDHLEKSLETVLDGLPVLTDKDIRFRGTIDRIDSLNNECRVLDYKTGFVEPKQLKFSTWEELISNPDKSKAFQLMVYAWVYSRQAKAVKQMKAGIISLRAPGKGAVPMSGPAGTLIDEAALKDFEVQLKLLVKEIFDTETPFTQTKDEDRCRYCDFREMCNRNSAKDYFS
jgi:hypothetical protein